MNFKRIDRLKIKDSTTTGTIIRSVLVTLIFMVVKADRMTFTTYIKLLHTVNNGRTVSNPF